MAEIGDFNSIKRGRYHIAQREWAKREIRNLLIFGYTNDEISDKLHIPKRTLERYLHDMFAEDIHLLDNASREQLEEQVQRFTVGWTTTGCLGDCSRQKRRRCYKDAGTRTCL